MSSVLTYNGVLLSYIKTNAVSHEPVYDETGSDYKWTKIRLAVSCYFNSALAPASPGESATETMVRVRHLLLTPRKQLLFTVGGDALIQSPAPASPTGMDADRGPKPESCVITQVGGSMTFMVDYTITTCVVECDENGSPPSYVSHRWQDTVHVDQTFFSTRTRQGKIVARSDMLANADSLRALATTGTLPPGHVRVEANYNLTHSGLELEYTLVDKEVYLLPPQPAVKAEGQITESCPDGGKRFAECHVKLHGAKTSKKDELIVMACLIAESMVKRGRQGPLANPGGPVQLVSYVVRTDLWENIVEAMIRVIIVAESLQARVFPGNVRNLARPPVGSDPTIDGTLPPDPGSRGTAGLLLIAAALNDPCLGQTVSQMTGNAPSTSTLANVPPPATVAWNDILPEQATLFADQNDGVYTDAVMKSHFQMKPNKVNLSAMTSNPNKARGVAVQLGAALLSRVTEWSLVRTGARPVAPDPMPPNDGNTSLLDVDITLDSSEPAADGINWIYRLAGRYVWGYADPSKVIIDAPLLPWVSAAQGLAASQMLPEAFVTQLTQGGGGDGQSPFSALTGWRGTSSSGSQG